MQMTKSVTKAAMNHMVETPIRTAAAIRYRRVEKIRRYSTRIESLQAYSTTKENVALKNSDCIPSVIQCF